jgi:general secretion pathway protein C
VNDNRRMLLRSLMLLVWALVAASSVFWGMRLMAKPLPVPPGAAVATTGLAADGDLTALLGVKPPPEAPAADDAPPPPPESSRFQLIGVVAARHAARAQGVALIAVDGKTPRAYRVGAVVEGDLVLQSVQQRGASIGPRGGAASVSLELPPLPPPATGVPGAAAAAMPTPMAGVPGLPPGQPFNQPGMPIPPQLAVQPALVPGGAPNANLLPQARFRAQRFDGAAGNPAAAQPAMQPGQEEAQPVDPAAPVDHRSQR